jgi:hypothetical protein
VEAFSAVYLNEFRQLFFRLELDLTGLAGQLRFVDLALGAGAQEGAGGHRHHAAEGAGGLHEHLGHLRMAFVHGLEGVGEVQAVGLSLGEEGAPEIALRAVHRTDSG